MYVASHCTSGRTEQSDSVEKTRRNRVKSELITRGKVKEVHFVTDKKCPESYKTGDGEPRNVVIVLLPACVEDKVLRKVDKKMKLAFLTDGVQGLAWRRWLNWREPTPLPG